MAWKHPTLRPLVIRAVLSSPSSSGVAWPGMSVVVVRGTESSFGGDSPVGSGGNGSVGVGGGSRSLSAIRAVLLVSPKCTRLSLICFLVLPGRNSRILMFTRLSPRKRRSKARRRSISSCVHTVGVLPGPPAGVSAASRRLLFLSSGCACLSCWERPMAVHKCPGTARTGRPMVAWPPPCTWECDIPWRVSSGIPCRIWSIST